MYQSLHDVYFTYDCFPVTDDSCPMRVDYETNNKDGQSDVLDNLTVDWYATATKQSFIPMHLQSTSRTIDITIQGH